MSLLPLNTYLEDTRLVFSPSEDIYAIIENLCRDARQGGFRGVCVRPEHIALAKSFLQASNIQIVTVIGFPKSKSDLLSEREHLSVGDVSINQRLQEIQQALADGVDELDIVMNVSQFLSAYDTNCWNSFDGDLNQQVQAAQGKPVKLILETDLLVPDQIRQATQRAVACGVSFIKTSTGMLIGGQGATIANIQLIASTLLKLPNAQAIGIKASGGIRTRYQAIELLNAGATVIGTSNATTLLSEATT